MIFADPPRGGRNCSERQHGRIDQGEPSCKQCLRVRRSAITEQRGRGYFSPSPPLPFFLTFPISAWPPSFTCTCSTRTN